MPNGPNVPKVPKVPPAPARKWPTVQTRETLDPAAPRPGTPQWHQWQERNKRIAQERQQQAKLIAGTQLRYQQRTSSHREAMFEEIRQKGTERIIRKQYEAAPSALLEIRMVCQQVLMKYPGGRLSVPDLKGKARAAEKVASDYMGDWWSIKDIARLTIVLLDDMQCQQAANDVVEEYQRHAHYADPSMGKEGINGHINRETVRAFEAQSARRVAQYKIVLPEKSPTGYSGWTVFVRTSNGAVGEIQINNQRIIYAKEKESVARNVLGNAFDTIKAQYGLPCGMGHALYEIARAPGVDAVQKAEAEKAAVAYNAYFRARTPDPLLRHWLEGVIAAMGLDHH